MSEWHLARNGEQEGPYTARQVGAMLANGELKAGEALAWKEGMPEWKPLPESGLLAEVSMSQAPSSGGIPRPTGIGAPSPAAARSVLAPPRSTVTVNPYAAPSTLSVSSDLVEPVLYPGIGRLAYFGLQFAVTIGAYLILFLVILGARAAESPAGVFGGTMLAMVAAGVAGLYIGVKRVQNLGMSGWAILWSLVPIMSIWISWRMFACPAGYEHHRQLDTAGKVLTGLLIALIVLGVLANIFAEFS